MNRSKFGSRGIILCLFSLFILFSGLEAGERRGAEVVVQKLGGDQIHGELIAVKKTSLLLLDSASGIDVSVNMADIGIVHIIKGPKTGIGAISGFLVGGVVGAAATGKSNDCGQCQSSASRYIIGGALVGGIGALIGALIGSQSGSNEIIIFQGVPPDELDAALEKLSSKARLKNVK